jgi:GNAT superfamily N-acetyltransferase
MKAIIRPAAQKDCAALALLSHQLGYPAEAQEMRGRLRGLEGSADHAVFVAEQAGQVVAWLHVQKRSSLEVPDYAEITGMVVDEACRGLGLGAQLVQAAETWAKGCGLATLRVRSNVIREKTHSFYRKQGFTVAKSQMVFQKSLADKRSQG